MTGRTAVPQGINTALTVLATAGAGRGMAGKEPFFLGALLFSGFAVITGFVAIHRHRRRLRSVITRDGREVLKAARDHHPRGAQDQSSLAFAVALYGLRDAPDRTLCGCGST
ncbi:hypothetical protein [Nonomuraea solani]|uniref:hypothetical protein n=1 Tax=Nonomuraea solani TaxID=1144553 RepID=UPI0011B0DC7C|nr:hypothetical protein [Nonomuraea solani]